MKQALAVLAILTMVAFAGQIRVDLPGGPGGTDDELTYFNGTPHWLTWGGMYRGTWFNTDDFMPGSTSFNLEQMEYWFFESTNTDPWDTDDFYSEIWNGDDMGPLVLLAQSVVTALHYAPCYHNFSPALVVEQNFWGLINSEMSAGGWPSILGDYSMAGTHSWFSDDFIVWEPWGDMGEYYIVANGTFALNSTTWGAVKALF